MKKWTLEDEVQLVHLIEFQDQSYSKVGAVFCMNRSAIAGKVRRLKENGTYYRILNVLRSNDVIKFTDENVSFVVKHLSECESDPSLKTISNSEPETTSNPEAIFSLVSRKELKSTQDSCKFVLSEKGQGLRYCNRRCFYLRHRKVYSSYCATHYLLCYNRDTIPEVTLKEAEERARKESKSVHTDNG